MPLFGKPLKVKEINQKERPQGIICDACKTFIKDIDLEENLKTCPKCGYHFKLDFLDRIKLLCDEGSFKELYMDLGPCDFLLFKGYENSLKDKQEKTGINDAVVCGFASNNGINFGLAVMDFRFMGASMGSVVGEKITLLIEDCTKKKCCVVFVTASGGARMQEGTTSLMQMAKTSGALALHHKENLSSICILTHPTYGGVTASFASLGDIIISEPKAMVGFAGKRVIENTIKSKLPEGFQEAEFLEEHGLVDRIIHRKNLKKELGILLDYLNAS